MGAKIDGDHFWEAAAIAAFAVLAFFILKTLAFLFIPMSIALLCCYVLGAPLDFMKRRGIPQALRILAVTILALVAILLLVTLVKSNIRQFQDQIPLFEKRFWDYADGFLAIVGVTRAEASEILTGFVSQLKGEDLKPLGVVAQWVGASFFGFLGNLFGIVFYLLFMLAERETFAGRVTDAFGPKRAASMLDAMGRINRAVEHYLGLKSLMSLITGVLVTLALWVLGVPFALLCGVTAFVLNFIPNIGSIIAAVPPVAITLFQSGSLGKTFLVAIAFTIIQVGVGNVLEPRLMGKGLNLSPLVILLSLVFWGWMWGITGMLVSVPLTAAARIALEQFDKTRPIAVLMSAAK